MRRAIAGLLSFGLVSGAVPDALSIGAAPIAAPVTVQAVPRWGVAIPDRWTPYVVTVRNEGSRHLEGEVRLLPAPVTSETSPRAGPYPRGVDSDPWGWALGAREVTAPHGAVNQGGPAAPARYSDYRSRLTVAAGAEKSVTIVVLEAPSGYRAEFRGPDGRALGSSTPANVRPEGRPIALWSRVPGVRLPSASMELVVTQMTAPHDVPDEAIGLSGLAAVVIADFDTQSLNPRQIEALRHYVALGGNLVLGGGLSGQRTVAPLPDELRALRPTGTSEASIGALAELADLTASVAAPISTGDLLRQGRVLLESRDGAVLVADRHYGAGRVVQLGYDPLAEPLASDRALAELAWDQGLLRAGAPWGTALVPYFSALAPADQLWAPVLEPVGWPSVPGVVLALLAAYAALAGPVVFGLVLSRRKRLLRWIAFPLVALGMTVAVPAMGRPEGRVLEVVIDTLAPGEAVLTNRYRTTWELRPGGGHVPGDTASALFTEPGAVRPFLLDELLLPARFPRGMGGGTVLGSSSGPKVEHSAERWEPRTAQSVAITRRPGGLEAHLHLVGTAKPPASGVRIAGTVTNHGAAPLRQVRVQLPEGAQARVAAELAPGATVHVDAPVLWATRHPAGTNEKAERDDLLLFAAASRAFTRPGQVAVVALGSLAPERRQVQGGIALTVQPVALEAATQLVAYTGQGEMVASRQSPSGTWHGVYDLSVLPGTSPGSAVPGSARPSLVYGSTALDVTVFNWQTRQWRPLPTTSSASASSSGNVSASLLDAEIRDGVVRIRGPQDMRAALQIGVSE